MEYNALVREAERSLNNFPSGLRYTDYEAARFSDWYVAESTLLLRIKNRKRSKNTTIFHTAFFFKRRNVFIMCVSFRGSIMQLTANDEGSDKINSENFRQDILVYFLLCIFTIFYCVLTYMTLRQNWISIYVFVSGRPLLFDSKRSVKVFELQDAQSQERKDQYNSLNNDPMFRIVRSLRIMRHEVLQKSFERDIGFYIRPRIVWWETREISFMLENYNKSKKLKYGRLDNR